jgi:photosystem II stability/assembly factor-like uncharacterized protein
MKKHIALLLMAALLLLPCVFVMPGNAQQSGQAARKSVRQRGATVLKRTARALKASRENDPDTPAFLRNKIDKREYLLRRQEQISMWRGTKEDPLGTRRARAIREMERQERLQQQPQAADAVNTPLVDSSIVWTPIGPAPIPNGQTFDEVTPVAGRTVAIAVHPTDPNIVYIGTAQGGLYRTLDGGVTFTALTDKALSLAIGAVAIAPSSPSTIYIGTGETSFSGDGYAGVGVYRIDNADGDAPVLNGPFSMDGSAVNVLSGRGISRIAVDPTDAGTIYVGTSSAIGGIGGDPPAGAPSRGIFRSTNALSAAPTFTKLNLLGGADRRVMDIVLEPGNANNMLVSVAVTAGTEGGVYRSTNATSATPTFTQTLSITAFTSIIRGELAINKVGATVTAYYASGEIDPNDSLPTCESQGDEGTLRKSTDGGATWGLPMINANGFCGPQCFYDIAVAVDPSNANNVLIGGNVPGFCSRLLGRSTNGGANFLDQDDGLHADNHVLAFAPSNPSIVYDGNDGGLYRSMNGGANWFSINRAGFQATQFQSLALHPLDRHFMIGGTQDNGTEFLQPNFNWKRADFGDGGFALIDQGATDNENVTMYHTYFNASTALLGFARMNLTSCANEAQWSFKGIYTGLVDPTIHCDGTTDSFNGISIADAVEFYAPIALGPGTPNTVYFGSDKLYRSINKGDTAVVSSQTFASTVTAIGISRQDDNRRLAGLRNGQVFATTTGVPPMTDVTGPIPPRYISRAVVDPNNVNTAYVTLAGFGLAAGQHVWKTTNLNVAAPTWTAMGTGIPDVPVNAFVIDPSNSNFIYAGTDIGVYRSTDAGASWTPFGIGFPRVAVFDMAIQNIHRVLRVTTHGRGMWEIKLNPVAAKVSDFNGDGRSDLAVERPSTGTWYVLNSTLSVTDPQPPIIAEDFPGFVGDQLVPGDYNGDGKTDLAVFRPSDNFSPSGSGWHIRINGGGDISTTFGVSGDKPMQSDYDGDGKTDLAVYRPDSPVAGQATFFVQRSSDNGLSVAQWGLSTDKPVAGDFDGDGEADYAVFRPSTGVWYVLKSSCNFGCFDGAQWGLSTDKLVPADYDGDGKFDRAVYRPSNGTWYVLKSGDGAVRSVQWGNSTDTPVPGDYDGDGMTDFAVWRGSAGDWFVLKSSNQPVRGQHWGQAADIPVAARYVPEQ